MPLLALVPILIGFATAIDPFASASAEFRLAMAPQEKKKCVTVGDKRICFEDDAKNRNDDDDKPKKKKTGNKCQGEISCPAGYVVLDKPNKYGACCEPKDASPDKQPAPAAEKCKFPGQVGTPPDCSCPPGTEFRGYKGCVRVGGCHTFLIPEQASTFKCGGKFPKRICSPDENENGKPKCCCYAE